MTIAGFSFGLLAASQDVPPFVNDWKGAFQLASQDVDCLMHLSLGQDGKLKGALAVDSLGQLPLEEIAVVGRTVSYWLQSPAGMRNVAAELDPSGKILKGTLRGGGKYDGAFSAVKVEKA